MSDLSLYNLGTVTAFTREWSSYPSSEDAPFLSEGLVGYNCCVTYFRSYVLRNGGIFSVDPGLPRNERAISLDDGVFEPCGDVDFYGNSRPLKRPHSVASTTTDDASVLVYPGCTVVYRVSGKVYYNTPGNNISQEVSNYVQGGVRHDYGWIEVNCSVREGLDYYLKLDANGDPIPDAFDPVTGRPTSYELGPFSTCCPVTAAITEQSNFTFASGDGLNWNNMVTNNPYSAPTYNEPCQRSQYAANNVYNNFYVQGAFYPSCLNFTSNSVPNVDYESRPGERVLTYNLLATFGHAFNVYCCQGAVTPESDFTSFPGTVPGTINSFYCTEVVDCDDRSTCGEPVSRQTEDGFECRCFYPIYENRCGYYKNIYLEFTYQNKSNCIAQIGLDDYFGSIAFYGDDCTGSDVKVEVQVVDGPPGCNFE